MEGKYEAKIEKMARFLSGFLISGGVPFNVTV